MRPGAVPAQFDAFLTGKGTTEPGDPLREQEKQWNRFGMTPMSKRARRRRAGRGRARPAGKRPGLARLRPAESMSDRDKLEFLEAAASAVLDEGATVTLEGETVTFEDLEALRELLDEIPAGYTGPVELPPALARFRTGPRPPADAAQAWPENIAGHDQAKAALLDFLVSDGDVSAAVETLRAVGGSMPPSATVAELVELADGHVLATLLNPDGDSPVVTMAFYTDDDPERFNDPADASVMLLTD